MNVHGAVKVLVRSTCPPTFAADEAVGTTANVAAAATAARTTGKRRIIPPSIAGADTRAVVIVAACKAKRIVNRDEGIARIPRPRSASPAQVSVKLRRAMEPTSGKLEGTVEVDESFVGGNEPGVRGRLSRTKAKVIIAIESADKAQAECASGRSRTSARRTLCGLVQEVVEDGSRRWRRSRSRMSSCWTKPASKRRKRKMKAARKKRAAGTVGAPVNVPRLQPRRPGGKTTKLTDAATAKRRFAVKGRRGLA